MASPLPNKLSRSSFNKAFREFSSIVGKQWASSAQEDREQYIDAYNPGDPLEFVSGGFVAPAAVEEVQAIVQKQEQDKLLQQEQDLARTTAEVDEKQANAEATRAQAA